MELVITEKPSVAQSIAKVIGATERCEGFLKGSDYIVSWCVGHLVELSEPDKYDERYKQWRLDDLPIIPKDWLYEVKKDTEKQFIVVKKLMTDPDVTSVICATDAGREGELIFRLVYEQAGCRKPVKRLWISSMEETAIRSGFADLRSGSDYDNLYRSALCRQQADWLVGLNGTRLFTALYRRKVLKVGRVQTPTLAMLVEREEAIRSFVKKPFYTVHMNAGGIDAVSEKYQEKEKAESVAERCRGNLACVSRVFSEEKYVAPPKLYDLTTLQRDANRLFGLTAKKTLQCTQSLYEKKLCTYPRTDSMYLTDDMEDTAANVMRTAEDVFPYLNGDPSEIPDIKRTLNSGKVSDHHAIIPTEQIKNIVDADLSEDEMKILSLISARLIEAASGRYVYKTVKAEIECAWNVFTVTGRCVVTEGWKKAENALRKKYGIRADKEDEEKPVPQIKEGMILSPEKFSVVEGFTKPPKHYTEDSLLLAMEHAGAEETNDDAERKGLGTPATRADIIEKLVRDGFVKREKKQMLPTDDGVKLITVLPDVVKSPGLTADWENALALVARGEYAPEQFMEGIRNMITDLVKTYDKVREENRIMFGSSDALGKCPKCGGDIISGKFGPYCSEKCGMSVGKAMGKQLTDEEVKDLLEGKPVYMTGLKSRKGGTYNAYVNADGIEEYSFTKDDGTEVSGYRMKYKLEFPKKEDKAYER